jgi:hypothetical protein
MSENLLEHLYMGLKQHVYNCDFNFRKKKKIKCILVSYLPNLKLGVTATRLTYAGVYYQVVAECIKTLGLTANTIIYHLEIPPIYILNKTR